MPDWVTFAAATVALTLLLLFLTRRSQRLLEQATIVDRDVDRGVNRPGDRGVNRPDDRSVNHSADRPGDRGHDADDPVDGGGTDAVAGRERAPTVAEGAAERESPAANRPVLTTELLLANAALSQLFALLTLAAVAWWTGVPASAFGLGAGDPLSTPAAIAVGVAAGIALYAGNEVAAALGAQVGVSAAERLREAMAPDDARGWGLLLGVVLPIIAVFEEALFRGALIGAFAIGLAVDPWLLAVGSSVAFGAGHGAQGRLGIAVTGALGFLLAGLFIVTGSLLVAIVAHYVVNAAEFVVREGLGADPLRSGH